MRCLKRVEQCEDIAQFGVVHAVRVAAACVACTELMVPHSRAACIVCIEVEGAASQRRAVFVVVCAVLVGFLLFSTEVW